MHINKTLSRKVAEDFGKIIAHTMLASRCMSDTHPEMSAELEAISKRVEQLARQYTKETKPYEIFQER